MKMVKITAVGAENNREILSNINEAIGLLKEAYKEAGVHKSWNCSLDNYCVWWRDYDIGSYSGIAWGCGGW